MIRDVGYKIWDKGISTESVLLVLKFRSDSVNDTSLCAHVLFAVNRWTQL